MVSEREIEAAREVLEQRVYDEGGCEVERVPAMVREMLEAAARVRAEDNAGEPVAWTGSGSLKALEIGRDGFMWPNRSDAHPVPLYLHAAPQPSGPVGELADALRGLLKAYENAFDWTAELPPETAEAERIANEVLEALTSSKPEQAVPSEAEAERERIAKDLEWRFGADTKAESLLMALHDAGYRILAPGEVDAETLERAAEVARHVPTPADVQDPMLRLGYISASQAIADALRP